MKRIEVEGRFYRMRRGKLVEIPAEWVGKTTNPASVRKRPSKKHHKIRKLYKNGCWKDKRQEARDAADD